MDDVRQVPREVGERVVVCRPHPVTRNEPLQHSRRGEYVGARREGCLECGCGVTFRWGEKSCSHEPLYCGKVNASYWLGQSEVDDDKRTIVA